MFGPSHILTHLWASFACLLRNTEKKEQLLDFFLSLRLVRVTIFQGFYIIQIFEYTQYNCFLEKCISSLYLDGYSCSVIHNYPFHASLIVGTKGTQRAGLTCAKA